MSRIEGLLLGALLLGFVPAASARQGAYVEATPVTVTATITAIDQANQVITLKGPKGNSVEINAPKEMEGFKSLKVGDIVTATYFDAVALQVRKPGDPAPKTEPMTTTQRKDRAPGSDTRRQQTFTVVVQAVDAAAPSVTVKGPQGRVVTLAIRDPKQIQTLKTGDQIDVTYYESLLVKVARAPKQE